MPGPAVPSANRPVAMGVDGMVTSANPLASQAGVQVLAEGGNAFDAAVATAATLSVVEPYMSGLGGIGLALVYIAAEDRVRTLNFSGRAPGLAEPDRFTVETRQHGVLAPLVPGNVAGWLTLHRTYGSLDRQRLFRPAVSYAENGAPITLNNSRAMARAAPRLAAFPSGAIILDESGRAPGPGSRLRMPQLAKSLRSIAEHGEETFYRGELAEGIVKGNRELGGLYTLDDFEDYGAQWGEPIRIGYRGFEINGHPPNSSGFQILQTLKLIEGLDEPRFQHPDSLHVFMEAVKLCVADRIKYAGDPDHVDVPVDGLLSEAYAAQQRGRIDRGSAASVSGERYASTVLPESLTPGSPEEFDGGMTTHFAVADRDGNVVSITQTLGGGFGSGVAVGDTGIFLNNMSSWFDLEEGSPNRIGPRKRVDFVVSPTQTFKDGKLFLSIGTPGSWGILQTTPQMIVNVLDHGMNIQEAIEAPRFRCYEGTRVQMEERFPVHLRRALGDLGHEVDVIEAWSGSVGGAQGIVLDRDSGVLQGGADPRRDGYAIGL